MVILVRRCRAGRDRPMIRPRRCFMIPYIHPPVRITVVHVHDEPKVSHGGLPLEHMPAGLKLVIGTAFSAVNPQSLEPLLRWK